MNHPVMNYNEKKKLEHEIDILDFAMTELREYLDTHPYDRDAISYYQKYALMKKQAVNDYTLKFGMICIDTPGNTPDEWRWLKGPMPWEGGDC